jgi:hypothetical protein
VRPSPDAKRPKVFLVTFFSKKVTSFFFNVLLDLSRPPSFGSVAAIASLRRGGSQ